MIEEVKIAYMALADKFGQDIVVLDISGISVMADYFVIATGKNSVQIKSMADEAMSQLHKAGRRARHTEGYGSAQWVLLDFDDMIMLTVLLLKKHPEILEYYQDKFKYILVDEYQDTNHAQYMLISQLATKHQNICVVGDDDQGLYRFRGATIRNILEFPDKFDEGECQVIPLVINYRSNSDIIDFYSEWMTATEGAGFDFSWDGFRFDKKIEAEEKSKLKSPAVIKLSSIWDDSEWYAKILAFINRLVSSGKVSDYNQIAFLF